MASESPHPNGSSPQATVATPDGDAKRKAESQGGTHTRAKRNRYISIACNECKRRKIKCNGQVPCQRCGHLNLECLYAPNCCNGNFKESEEYRSMKDQIGTLEEQVNTLFSKLNDLSSQRPSPLGPTPFEPFAGNGSHAESLSPAPALPNRVRSKHPRFHGPTSSAFNFDVARSSLQNMGIAPNEDTMHEDLTPIPPETPQLDLNHATTAQMVAMLPTKDPIWFIRRDEAIRLCKVYEEEIGLMYPIFDIDKVIARTNLLYHFMEAANRTGFTKRDVPGLDSLQDDDTLNLKMILATTLVLEGNGQSNLAHRLFETVKPVFHAKMLEPADVKSVQLLTIVATYHFHTDNDIMSYRIIGMAARMCLELGLHRRDAIMKIFPAEADWSRITRLFWSVYSLDRRWAFGTGLPFVIQDDDIDPSLPEPDDSLPYLKSMVAYGRLSSKIWYSGLGYEGSTDVKREEIGFLDYQVCQWYKHIPESVMLPPDPTVNGTPVSRGMQRLRVLLYLRMNHLRILIFRPVLHSSSSIVENRSYAQTVVDIAKDTIRVLARLNQTSDIYRTQQICFNYFLVAALAVLFLAVCHAPTEFNEQARDEFYMALNLVSEFTTKSYISKRLWNTIKGVRRIAEKLGVFGRNIGTDGNDPHSNAAVAMAGLAGHPIEDMPVYGGLGPVSELGNSPMNGLQMSHELTNLFEAVGASGSFGPDNFNSFVPHDTDIQNSGEGLAGVLSSDAEFSRVLRNLIELPLEPKFLSSPSSGLGHIPGNVSGEVAQALAEGLKRLEFSQASTSTQLTDSGSFTMSSSEGPPESWITSFCSLMGHEYFAEVSEDFIEDDFNLTGLQSQVPMYKEALEMILDVEPEEDEEEEEEEDDDDDEDEPLGEEKPLGYRRAGDRKHMRVASDLSVIESSAELLYGLIHQRYITSRPGIQQMLEKYEVDHFGVCPRVNCNGCKVLPVGRTDTPGQETVKLFCPSCYDIYTPPNSRFQSVDGAFFGTTFGCLFFMTFPELDVGGDRAESILSPASLNASLANQSRSPSLNSSIALTAPSLEQAPNQPAQINGMLTSNFALGLGAGKIYEPRIYGFRVSERAKSGPRMQWLRMKPRDINELDESAIYYAMNGADEEEEYHDGDTEMGSAPAGSQQSVIDMRRKAPMRKRRHMPPSNPDRMPANGEGG